MSLVRDDTAVYLIVVEWARDGATGFGSSFSFMFWVFVFLIFCLLAPSLVDHGRGL